MVTSAAAADPSLARLLESVGLIKRDISDPTGWSIVTDSTDAESDTDRLTKAIEHLSDILAIVYQIHVQDQDVNDAEAALDRVHGALDRLNGKTATVYVNRVGVGPIEAATGGAVRFASGGVARLAELGPEMLRYPSGATGLAMTDGLYSIPSGTHVDTAAATREKVGTGAPTFDFKGATIYIVPPTPDIHDAIAQQFLAGGI
jgi:hypothetical protein